MTIDENRVLKPDSIPAYTGEQNAAALKIDISYWESRNPDHYILSFETSPQGEVFITAKAGEKEGKNAYIEEGFLICPLSSGLTSTGLLKIQLSAVINEADSTETVEKTSVASLEFSPSIAVGSEYYGSDSTTMGEIEKLREELDKISSFTEEFSFDYFAAALASRLLFKDFRKTPVYFPETAEKADDLIYSLTDDFDSSTMDYALITIPSGGTDTAKLCVFTMSKDEISINYYSGADLLSLLRTGVNI